MQGLLFPRKRDMSILIPLIDRILIFNTMFSLLELPGIFAICCTHTVKERKYSVMCIKHLGSIIVRATTVCYPIPQCSGNMEEKRGKVQKLEGGRIAVKQDVTELLR